MSPLAHCSNKELLTELFKRYREAVFIGNAGGMDPIHMATHFPRSTGMHSVLTVQLNCLVGNLKRRYPDLPLVPVPHTVNPCVSEEEVEKAAELRRSGSREFQKFG